ncbi:SulP family inorganic anion transporter [Acidovorax carolinensis]|uniref:SulP family inorganic anion transporter n=1 Tax=Acidovorax carolinensis TaxID=553814 RepID=UPI000B342AEE|nr:SulP family inorganic anion transporter [Acidovorax carolinensis]ART47429.1 sodium-independent anion transporter [Acidovorax carolinensis]
MRFSFAFRPRLLDALRGYSRSRWLADVGAGVTVGIVALPLAMAFAIASGLKPEAGLWTAIIGGFLIALLGGTNVQIGGPAGAFIVIVYGIVERYGVANLLISTACAGVLLFLLGMFKLGNLVRFVPVSIVIGFTNGIAVLIGLSQLKDWLGLAIDKMPGNFFSQVHTLALHIGSFNPHALALGAACLGGLFLWPRLFVQGSPVLRVAEGHTVRRFARIPAPVVALVTLTVLARWLEMPVETIGSKFGGIPQQPPAFALPDFSWDTVRLLVTPTVTIALLGAIESLLCARVADQVATDPHYKKHDPNQELMAQGVANFVVPFFGGMPATGTIARTVTNLRAGATSPIAGMVHAATLVVIVLVAAPLALHIPLAVLAGILLHVAWNMGEWHEFARLKHFSNHYRLLMLGTFLLTVVFDLTVAVEVGLVLSCVLFVRRMSALFRAEPESASTPGTDGLALEPGPRPRMAWHLHGALFFGAAAKIDPIVQAVEDGPEGPEVVLDARDLFALDTTGLEGLEQILKAVGQRGGVLWVVDAQEQPRSLMERSGFSARLAEQNAAQAASAEDRNKNQEETNHGSSAP